MTIEVLEDEAGRIKLKLDDLTFANVLNDVAWEHNAEFAAYAKEHPYLADPVMVVKAKNPKKVLLDAAASIEKDANDLRAKFEKALK